MPVAAVPAEPYRFEVEPAEVDLGILRPDEDASFEFAVLNQDARPLKILNIDGSCACSGFTWDRREVPPGASRTVQVVLKAQNRGSKILKCWVQAADRPVTTKELLVRYVIVPELAFAPKRADFGKRVVGSSGTLALTVTYSLPKDADAIALVPALADPLPIEIRMSPAEEKRTAGGLKEFRTRVELVLDTSKPHPPFSSELLFTGERHLPARVALTGTIHGGTYLDVEEIQLGVTAVGGTRRGSSRLFWTREQPRIEAIECDPPELKATAVAEEGVRAFRIQVTFEPKSRGELDGTVRLRTNLAPEPLLLKVKGTVR